MSDPSDTVIADTVTDANAPTAPDGAEWIETEGGGGYYLWDYSCKCGREFQDLREVDHQIECSCGAKINIIAARGRVK